MGYIVYETTFGQTVTQHFHSDELNLSGRRIRKIVKLFGHQLHALDLSHNDLTEVPDFILPNLRWLWLNNNKLTCLPDFRYMSHLRCLMVTNNQLSTLPDFQFLPELWSLWIGGNNIQQLPSLNVQSLYLFIVE